MSNEKIFIRNINNKLYFRSNLNKTYIRSGSVVTNPADPTTSLDPNDPSISASLTLWLDASQPVYDNLDAVVTPDLPCTSPPPPFSDVYKWASRASAAYGSQSFENNSELDQPYLVTDTGRRFLDFHGAYDVCTLGGLLTQQNGDENTLLNYAIENSNGYTIFVVAKFSDTTPISYQPIWSNVNADGIKIFYDSISNTITHSATTFFEEEISLSYGPPNSWKVFTFYLNRTSSSQANLGIKINNASSNSVVVDTFSSSFLIPDTFISSEVTLGKEIEYIFKGGLAEIITYKTYLGSNNISQVISGLMTKWSIT
jgi:hypothetical protein